MTKKKKNNQTYVYILHKEYAWIPALLVEQTKDSATVSVADFQSEAEISGSNDAPPGRTIKKVTVKLKDYPNEALPLQNVANNEQNIRPVPDMIDLSFLHEAAILYNLKARHVQNMPYTRTGDIVIAVNPYKWYPKLYTEENRTKYSRTLVWEAAQKDYDPRRDLPPHVYETSALAYKGLATTFIDQSILVSGESGAGKTETVKICMNHLASVVQQEHTQLDHDSEQDMGVITKVLDSNPLLEAFGNAKTRRNDNSSRFGKYIQLQLQKGHTNPQHLTLLGSECQVYLLEKSRVVRHDQELERTFHIFYQLLAAPDSVKTQFWSHLKGKNNTHFVYVGPTDTTVIEGVSDADQFEKTLKSLAIIGINGALLKTFMQAICVVLQLGNVAFGPDPKDSDHSLITSGGELHELASLMGIAAEKLQTTLTSRVVKVRNEETVVPLTVESAKDSTDALAKQLYDRIFLWLVRNINEATTAGGDEEEYGHIGLLDIFGFESFPVNSFEQLCINFANESLQSKFTKDVFVSVYAEYKDEGIGLEEITYDDNTHVLDLIQNRTGLLAMLNEECIRPNGSDYGFVNKALHANEKSPALIIPRIKNSEVEFGIRHYAGDVMYDATGFVTKNQDTLPTDLMACAQTSTNEIISMEIGITESSFTSNRSMPNRKQSNLVAPTAWSKYKTSLDTLMKNLHKSQSRYIRCVKPNSVKKPAVMEHSLTLQQLRSSGVISAVTLARSAFPNRLEHSKILDRFMFMFPPKDKSVLKKLDIKNSIEDQKEASGILLIHSLKSLQNEKTGVKAFVMGRTKAYFRAGALEFLEATRLKGLEAPAIKIQAVVRGHLVRTAAERRRKKEEREFYEYFSGRAVVIQSVVRMWLAGKERDARYVHFIKAQAKALKKNKKKKKLDKAATEIQRHLRGNYIRFRYAAVFEKVKEKNHLLEKVEKIKKKIAKTKKKKDEEMKKAKFGFDIEQDIKGTLEHSVVAGDFTEISETAHMVELLQSDYKQLQIRIKTQEGVLRPLKKNFDVLMEEQKALRDDYQKAHEKNEAIRKVNKELIEKREADLKKVEELKVELKHLHEKFAPVAHGRVDLQNGLQDILELIRNRCEDDDLVDDVLDVGRKAYSDASNLQEKATSDYQSHLMSSPEHIKKRLGLNKTPTSQSRRASDIVRRKILNNSFGSIGSPGLAVGTPETTKRKKKRESALF